MAIILPVVVFGCKTWSLRLREEYRSRMFVNRVQMRIFGPKRDEVEGGLRGLHNEELHNLYSSKTKLHGLSPRANYTDRATAACRRSDCQLLRIKGATWSA
jgi:hypothetical protein